MQEMPNPYQDLLLKAAQDEAFRTALLANPKATLSQFLGTELPTELTVNVVENTPTALTLVLPPPLTDELDDADLEAVAGGRGDLLFKLQEANWSLWTLGVGCLASLAFKKGDRVNCVR